jgi:hypothetical protein
MSLLVNFRRHLLDSPSIVALVGDRVCENRVPQGTTTPYIWYRRSGTESENTLDGQPGEQPFRTFFDLEVVADSPDLADDIVELVKFQLNLHQGPFGEQTVQGVFVEDHSDDYVRYNDFGDEGAFIPALEVEVVP